MLIDTINSVISQRFQNWELIIIDDGSSDNTKELVEGIKDDRIFYFYQNNAERSAARNNGISKSRGEYICFLDSDDLLLDNHLIEFNSRIEKEQQKNILLFTDYAIKKNGQTIRTTHHSIDNDFTLDYFLRYPVNPSRVCISREIAMEFEFREDAIIVEDMIYWLEVANNFPICQIPEVTVYYHHHEANSVNLENDSYSKMLKGLQNFIIEKPEIFNKISPNVRDEVFSEIYFGICKFSVSTNQRKKAILNLMKAIFSKPIHRHSKHRLFIFGLLLFSKLSFVKSKLLTI